MATLTMPDSYSTSERIRQEARDLQHPEPAPALDAHGSSRRGSVATTDAPAKVQIRDLNFWYGEKQVLKHISMDVAANRVTAFIGPSGCGKSTLLRCLNRMNELIPAARLEGAVMIDGRDIYQNADPVMVRRRIGMVFQKPNPFPKTIYENVLWGAKINGYSGEIGRAHV